MIDFWNLYKFTCMVTNKGGGCQWKFYMAVAYKSGVWFLEGVETQLETMNMHDPLL